MTKTLQFRPLLVGPEYEDVAFWKRINFTWVLQRIPMILFATVSSYGVGHLLFLSGLPSPFYELGGVSFDIGFLGVISLSDMQLKKHIMSHIAYYALNITMGTLAALFNVLSHAQGKYANITAEDITVGVPFAIVGLMFAWYYHSVMSNYIQRESEVEKAQEEQEAQTKERCPYCGVGKPSKNAIYGHYKTCPMKRMHTATNGIQCSCNICKQQKV